VDWWVNHPAFSRHQQEQLSDSLLKIEERLARIETPVPTPVPTAAKTSQP